MAGGLSLRLPDGGGSGNGAVGAQDPSMGGGGGMGMAAGINMAFGMGPMATSAADGVAHGMGGGMMPQAAGAVGMPAQGVGPGGMAGGAPQSAIPAEVTELRPRSEPDKAAEEPLRTDAVPNDSSSGGSVNKGAVSSGASGATADGVPPQAAAAAASTVAAAAATPVSNGDHGVSKDETTAGSPKGQPMPSAAAATPNQATSPQQVPLSRDGGDASAGVRTAAETRSGGRWAPCAWR